MVATGSALSFTHAQSADALIDKLVDKGILTVKEANELRTESDKDFNRAYSVKSGMPDWVNSLKFNGDLRGRFEGFYKDNPSFVDRNRFRFRMRFGVTAVMTDDLEVGMRLASGTTEADPISTNQTGENNASKKGISLDLAYAKWSPIHTAAWSGVFSLGKIENPFVFSEMMFDHDYTPEGLSQQFVYTLNDKHAFKLNVGEFVLDEVGASSRDPYMGGAQLRFDSTWNTHWQTTFGVGALVISGKDGLRGAFSTTTPARTTEVDVKGVPTIVVLDPATTAATAATVPDVNQGNTRDAGGRLVNNYNPIVVDSGITYSLESFPMYAGVFPIRVGGEYAHNPGADNDNTAYALGVTFGKASKKGTWDLGYKWKEMQRDFWWEELPDSDFGTYYETAPLGGRRGYQAGTNVRGHVFKATYAPSDSFTIGLTYFVGEAIVESPLASGSTIGRLQVDAIWKF